MKKRSIVVFISVVLLITISNIISPFINAFTEGIFPSYTFQTESEEFEFWAIPSKGRDIKMMERQFSSFKENNTEYSKLTIYRTFKRNPLKFWNWFNYLSNELYDYPYKEYKESSTRQ